MIPLRSATVTVANLQRSIDLYSKYLDYKIIETDLVSSELANSWNAPEAAGHKFAVLQPASGKEIYLRFVEQPPVDGFRALRSYGWNAIEICVTDVMAVHQRLQESPFEIIGPPRENSGLANIHPMQIKGPDEEVVFLTQINSDIPPFKLPRASSLIDQIFIMVIGCRDMVAAVDWFKTNLGFARGDEMQIAYTMLAKAYGKDLTTQYSLTTMVDDHDVFLEVDQYPAEAQPRRKHEGLLPPGCAITTFSLPNSHSEALGDRASLFKHDGRIYSGSSSVTLVGPDGALVEVVFDN